MAPQISVTLMAGVLVLVDALLQVSLLQPIALEFPEILTLPEMLIFIARADARIHSEAGGGAASGRRHGRAIGDQDP